MIAMLCYVLAMVLANLSVAYWGPWVSPINAFLLIGLDLSLRDHLHERFRGHVFLKMAMLIAVAGGISYALNPASSKIAIASMVAFLLANTIDAAVYHLMIRKPYLVKSNSSNVAGALVDSIVFPTLAFGALLPHIVAGQFIAKVVGAAVWAFLIFRLRRWTRV